VNLRRFDSIRWMTSEQQVWAIPEYLCDVAHRPLLTAPMQRNLTRMDRRLFLAGRLGAA